MTQQQITRPLSVLAPLIKEDLKEAERAGMPYYRAAGEKLIEAKEQLPHGKFGPWLKKHFKKSERQAQMYMALARDQIRDASRISSQREYQRHRSEARRQTSNGSIPPPPVNRVEVAETKRVAQKLISIGYKALAQEFHPDKPGGSQEAMARLNRIRDRLKNYIEME